MTAAAVRPDLFTHLFATQRTHPDRRDLAASALSLLLHGGVVALLIWAGTTLPAERTDPEPMPIPIVIATTEPTVTSGGGGGGGGGNNSRPLVLPPMLDEPIPDPGVQRSIDEPWAAPPSETPGSGRDSAGGLPGQGGDPEIRGGIVVSRSIPRLLNAAEVQRALERNYPPILRDAGIGGKVNVWLLIDENGRVIESEINQGSGHAALDSAAARVGGIMRFSPGMNRESRVKVWVSLPIVFRTR